ncbi:MAG: YkgJ family cysteine cluster protein [Promethearchaeota archaeon]
MTVLKYGCLKCGICCFEIPDNPGAKRIPLYPEEVDELIELAKEKEINFTVEEDLVFPDELNSKILVITYRIILNSQGHCPFFIKDKGCSIHKIKPYACQAYPLSLKRKDAFQFEITIDPLCKFVIKNYNNLKNKDIANLKEIFFEEYPKAEKFFRKNKKLQLKIRKLEAENKIKIARKITIEDFNNALKKWDRTEIRALLKTEK